MWWWTFSRQPRMHPAGEYPKGYHNHENYGGCARCYTPWNKTKSHSTWFYTDLGVAHILLPNQGAFPLCQDCWSSLTICGRLPYYEALVDFWASTTFNCNGVSWAIIRERLVEAVQKGG